ncbi:MAG: hypothetical protein IJW91_00435, partial [Phascolarctobacterium sp.]|nr:hypothetical protein [Phascolarctobacterium sp.]
AGKYNRKTKESGKYLRSLRNFKKYAGLLQNTTEYPKIPRNFHRKSAARKEQRLKLHNLKNR